MADKSALTGRYAIVGVGEAGLGSAPAGSTALSLQCRAARLALLEAGLGLADIDGVFAHWDDRANALLVAEYLGIHPRYVDSTVVGGQSNITHLVHAMAAIEAGLCEVALVTYGSTQRLDKSRARSGVVQDPRSPVGQFAAPYGMLNPVGYYAMLAQLYSSRYGGAPEDLGQVALAARRWAQLNPNAARQDPLTMADYLASPRIADPLRKLDICQINDGAGAMILTSADRARDLAQKPVSIRGFGDTYRHHLTPLGNEDWLDNGALRTIADDALSMAQLDRQDLDMVQIYDAFTINVLVALEALGFCEPGGAGAFVGGGRIAPGGSFPLNTSGGGLSFNHSGQFGMQLMIEAVRQLRGECGPRQVPGARTCLVQAGGMVMSAHMVMVLDAA
ncbi:thiolase C-terminal domain-containing protein [Nocardia lijiangensis]|uniref:thiolase C-terminal domain-containing protein n=1 Tax=Nocardia lijiangensis TaxID=299618 RepID=UPI00082BC425|nr:thiolase [Nocardia lijiangensis]